MSQDMRTVLNSPDRGGPDRQLVRQHDIARELGVNDKRVATWRSRSRVNHFPEPVACQFGPHRGGGKKGAFLWDLGEVLGWFSRYNEAAQRGRTGPHWTGEKEA